MLHLETVASANVLMLLGCVVGVGFMVRFLVALTVDGKQAYFEHTVRPGGLHYAADASRHRGAVANSASHLAIGVVRITTALTWNAGSGPKETARAGCMRRPPARPVEKLMSQPSAVIARAEAAYESENTDMRDIIFVALTVAFFLISIAYVKFCDRIR